MNWYSTNTVPFFWGESDCTENLDVDYYYYDRESE